MADEQTSMSSKRLTAVAMVAIVGLIGVSIFLQPRDIAVREDNKDSQQQEQSGEKETESEKTETPRANLSYTAEAGDSYTLFARQAVAVLGGSLSPAERVAAETKLSQDAGAPHLEVGQTISFDRATVQAAVDWAASLSDSQKAAWQPYADLVVLPSIK